MFYQMKFRIESGYKWGSGMPLEKCLAFFAEIKKAFQDAGWVIDAAGCYGNCVYVVKGKTRLYVHPMELSGACEESLVHEVEAVLKDGKTWKSTDVVRLQELVDSEGDDLLRHYRENRTAKTDRQLLDSFRVKFPCKPRLVSNVLPCVALDIHVGTVDCPYAVVPSEPALAFVRERFDDLVRQGRIISDGTVAHTATEREMDEIRAGLIPGFATT